MFRAAFFSCLILIFPAIAITLLGALGLLAIHDANLIGDWMALAAVSFWVGMCVPFIAAACLGALFFTLSGGMRATVPGSRQWAPFPPNH